MLWELHEIRHELHKEILSKKVDEMAINLKRDIL